jgi:peptide/nickel transport system permease protein
MREKKTYSYWGQVKSAFWQRRSNRWAWRGLLLLVFIAVFGDFIANEKPLYCKIDGQHSFPVVKQYGIALGWVKAEPAYFNANWAAQEYESVIFPPIPYSAGTFDRANMQLTSPLGAQNIPSWRWRHWLGTDEIGRDIAAGLISGTRTALQVGLIAMSIATVIGLFMGLLAGYFGDDTFRVRALPMALLLLASPFLIFYAFVVDDTVLPFGGSGLFRVIIFLVLSTVLWGLGSLLGRGLGLRKSWILPLDSLIMRLIEVINSLPGLLLILAVLAIVAEPSITYVMIVIGLISWTSVARYIRAELLRIRSLDYMLAGKALGYSHTRLLWRHALPNGIRPVLIALSFGMAGAVLVEAYLSFLGIGLPAEAVTWGSLIRKIQANATTGAWWIALFPGLAIFFTVTIFNFLGEGLTEAMSE